MSIWKRLQKYLVELFQGPGHTLSVLMWKHLNDRKHRWIGIVLRVIQGCSVFLALLSVRLSLLPPNETQHPGNVREYDTNKILFKPRNSMTEILMESLKNDLNWIDLASGTPSVSWEFDFFDDKTIFNDSSEIILLLDFQDTKENVFNYSITTLLMDPTSERDQPFQEFLNDLTPLEADVLPILGWLQWAIDRSYMEHFEKLPVSQELKVYKRVEYIPGYLTVLQCFIHLCTIIAPLPFFLNKTSKLTYIKRIGLQKLLRLSGVSPTIYRISHLLDTIVISSIYAVIIAFILKVTANPILPYSNPVIIVISIVLYFLNLNALAFVASTLSSDYNYAGSIAILMYISSAVVGLKWFTQEITSGVVRILVSCFLPHAPIFMFWDKVIYLESIGKGATFSEINQMLGYRLPITVIWLLLVMHLLCLLILDWYLDQVIPSRFGVTQKWNFIFTRKIYSKKKKIVNFHVTAEQNVRVLRDSRYFETGPKKAEIVVKVINLTKKYVLRKRQVAVLDNICMDMYRGEVTVILGSQASGKSSLLCVISGMQSPTSGTVYVNGMDNVARLSALQDVITFSPQQISLFQNLTVRENIIFCEKLQKKQTESLTDELIDNLRLTQHQNLLCDQLPTELRRCLQIACNVAYGADVLVFDEVTLDMGIEARHRVWDLIMELRGEKTIIMSTGNLEEASMLGDRIAILNKGKLRCYGSPSFLSEAIGIGLNLTITLVKPTYLEALQRLVEKTIPDVKSQSRGTRGITFMLPQKQRDLFVDLIETLEAKKKEFGITTIDVGGSMEAVYLEFIDTFNDEEFFVPSDFEGSQMERRHGWIVVKTQLIILIKRVYHYVWKKKYQFMCLQVILPILGLFLVTFTTNRQFGYANFIHVRGSVKTMLLDDDPLERALVTDVVNKFGVKTLYSHDVEKDLDNPSLLPDETIGLSMTKNLTKIFVPEDHETLSKSLNLYSNLYLRLQKPKINKTIVTTYKTIKRSQALVQPKPLFLCLNWSVWVSFLSMLPLAPFIMLAIAERTSGTRDIHIMAGCSPIVHWSSKLMAYMSIYIAIMPMTVYLIPLFFDFDKTFDHVEFLGVLLLILIFFSMAFLAHLQFLSFILHDYLAIGQIYFMSLGFGIIVPVFMLVLEFQANRSFWLKIIYIIILIIGYFSPLYVFSASLFHLVSMARLNAYCVLNKHLCPNLLLDDDDFETATCCNSSENVPFTYFDSKLILNLGVVYSHIFLYMTLVILLQKRILQNWLQRMLFFKYKPPHQRYFHNTVRNEKKLARDRVLSRELNKEMFIAHKVCKKYYRFRNKIESDNAVQGVTFLAKKGECIGILGPTGAGKSTLLRLLAGCVTMTKGDSWVAGFNIRRDRTKYLHKIGLVSRSGGLDNFYTGRENLVLICQLAGYSRRAAERMATLILQDLGLLKYANTLVEKYSPSCWHRLLLCVVYILDPAVAFIDEPMKDVDQATRSLIVKTLEKLVAGGTTVIVTETSLDWYEMESVYNRIAILYGGQIIAIGPAGDIVRELTTGFSVHLKLKVVKTYYSSLTNMATAQSGVDVEHAKHVQALKDDFKVEFPNSNLVEEHVCTLYIYIKDDDRLMTYRVLFTKLHTLLDKHRNILESYSFNKTTIEEVFWRIPHLIDYL